MSVAEIVVWASVFVMAATYALTRRGPLDKGGQIPPRESPPSPAPLSPWDASQIKQPGWNHIAEAFIEGARQARANPDADEAVFRRAADGYTKRVFEEVDPVSEAALRTESWRTPGAHGFTPPPPAPPRPCSRRPPP